MSPVPPEEIYMEDIIFLPDEVIDSMRVVDLREELKARKLSRGSNKPVLVEKLKDAVSKRVPSYILVVSRDDDQDGDQPDGRLRNFTIANNCCYIVFKDKKNVTFYCNDVTGNPWARVVDPKDD